MTVATPATERFDGKFTVEPMYAMTEESCRLWTDRLDKDGYGTLYVREKKSPVRAHRFSFERDKGPIPEGLQLDHLCRVRSCVNPDHLEPVTNLENHRRGHWAMQTHCRHGHPFSGDNLIVLPRGERRCRTCQADRMRRWYLKKKES